MKLLICTQALDQTDPILGFFCRWVYELAQRCESVIVICLREGVHDLPENVSVYCLGKQGTGRSSLVARIMYAIRFLRKIASRRRAYDAVLVHMNPEYMILGGLFWRFWGKRAALWYAHGAVNVRLRLAVALSHIVFTSSAKSMRVKTRKKRVIGHGIDTEQFSPAGTPAPPDEFTVLSVGRISPVKGYETLIDAMSLLAASGAPIRLVIAGGPGTPEQGAYLHTLKQRVAQKGLAAAVSFLGPVAHEAVPALMRRAHLFAHTGGTGSLDKVVLEAMAAGVPVVSSNEAVQEILPADLSLHAHFDAGDAAGLAERIRAFQEMPGSARKENAARARACVVGEHTIQSLVSAIVRELGGVSGKRHE